MSLMTINMFSDPFRKLYHLDSEIYAKPSKYSRINVLLLNSNASFRDDVVRSLALKSPKICCSSYSGKRGRDQFASNMDEVSDEMYDDLLAKYGEVIFQRKDGKPSSVEVDDDAISLSFAVDMARVADEVKGGDIKVLFVKPLVYWTSFFVIASAFSRSQIDAIRYKIRDLAATKYQRVGSGDSKPNSWTLLDFGDVVIHVFLPEQRALYNLEEFYGNAINIELPFQNQQLFGR